MVMRMFTKGWSASYKLRSRFGTSPFHPYKSLGNSPAILHNFPMNNQGLQFIGNDMGIWTKLTNTNITTEDEREKGSEGAGSGGPSRFNFSLWAKCLLGSVLSFFLPFWKGKWANLKVIEGEAEMVVEGVETVAEVVEKVATTAEKVSAEMAENLPDDSNLKKAAKVVEHVSEVTAQDAHATTQFINQVEAIKQDMDGLESLVEPIVNKIGKQGPQPKENFNAN